MFASQRSRSAASYVGALHHRGSVGCAAFRSCRRQPDQLVAQCIIRVPCGVSQCTSSWKWRKPANLHRFAEHSCMATCNPVLVWAPLTLCALIGLALERVAAVSRWTSSIFLSMAAAAVMSHFGVLPDACAVYDTVWNILMPLGTALLLLRSPSLFVALSATVYSLINDLSDNIDGRSASSSVTDVPTGSSGSVSSASSSPHYSSYYGSPGHTPGATTDTGDQRVKSSSAVAVAIAAASKEASRTFDSETEGSAQPSEVLPQQQVVAFGVATMATILGTLVAWVLVGRGTVATGAVDKGSMATLAAGLCASYIGGSVNFAAILQALKTHSAPLVASTLAVDNVATLLFLSAMFLIPGTTRAKLPAPKQAPRSEVHGLDVQTSPSGFLTSAGIRSKLLAVTQHSVATGAAVAVASICCLVGRAAAHALGVPGFQLALVAVVADATGSVLQQLVPGDDVGGREMGSSRRASQSQIQSDRAWREFESRGKAGAAVLSSLFLAFFFATIGAAAGQASLSGALPFVLFVLVQLSVHGIFTAAAAALLKIPPEVAMVASNAAVGGPATAAAMAAARGWTTLIPSAVMLGGIGYGIGTWIGLWVHRVLLLM